MGATKRPARQAYIHRRARNKLLFELTAYFNAHPIGEAPLSENPCALSPTIPLAPDVTVILGNQRATPSFPDIVGEVLSPSETIFEIHRKLRQYFQAGVKEVWLIYLQSHDAEIWTGPTLPERTPSESETLTSALLPGFAVTLPLAPGSRATRQARAPAPQ